MREGERPYSNTLPHHAAPDLSAAWGGEGEEGQAEMREGEGLLCEALPHHSAPDLSAPWGGEGEEGQPEMREGESPYSNTSTTSRTVTLAARQQRSRSGVLPL